MLSTVGSILAVGIICLGCQKATEEGQIAQPVSGAVTTQQSATTSTTTAAGASVASSAVAAQAYWPRFHGPNQDNISPDTGLARSWPQGGPPLVWKARGIGEGYSSVTIANGRIFTAGNIDDKSMVTALDINGRILWQNDAGPAWTKSHPGTRGTPTVDGDYVYYESPLGVVACFEAATGKKIWSVNIVEKFNAKLPTWALAESVLIDGDHVICCPGGPQASMVALNKRTGEVVWAAEGINETAGYASPVLVEWAGRRIVLTMTQKALIGVDADRGKLLFRHEHITRWDVNALMPYFDNGYVFISSGYGSGSEMLKLVPNGDSFTVERVWETKDMDNHHNGIVVLNGYIYGSSHQGPQRDKWVCLDWKTGKTTYAERGIGKGSLTCADGLLFIVNERSGVALVPADPTKHEIVGQFQLPGDGSGPTWAHPVVCGGRLYIRHGDVLYAYDVTAK